MNRRGFLQSLLGVAAGAALPAKAVAFLAENASLADAAFREKAIIDLLEARIAAATEMMCKQLEESLFSEGTFYLANDKPLEGGQIKEASFTFVDVPRETF